VRLDPDQLEWIVREVVRRLQGDAFRSAPPRGEGPGEASAPPRVAHITLTQSLITTATLERQLDGVTHVTVPKRAIVTPAVHDLLKERNIQLTRT
jgi:hypothetical protein